MEMQERPTVGELAASSLAAVNVFEKYGIDYCCAGKRPLEDVCFEKGLAADSLVKEIGAAIKTLRREGRIGILLVEQYLDFCLDVGDSFSIMDRGSIVAEGPIQQLSDDIVKQHLTV